MSPSVRRPYRVPRSKPRATAAVRAQVGKLEKLPRASLDALEVVHAALAAVLEALASSSASEAPSYRRAVATLGAAVEGSEGCVPGSTAA